MASFTIVDSSLDFILIALLKKLLNADSTPELSRPSTCFICQDETKEWTTSDNITAYQSIAQILLTP